MEIGKQAYSCFCLYYCGTNISRRWESNKSYFYIYPLRLTACCLHFINLWSNKFTNICCKRHESNHLAWKVMQKLGHQYIKSDLFREVNRVEGRNQEGLLFFIPTWALQEPEFIATYFLDILLRFWFQSSL